MRDPRARLTAGPLAFRTTAARTTARRLRQVVPVTRVVITLACWRPGPVRGHRTARSRRFCPTRSLAKSSRVAVTLTPPERVGRPSRPGSFLTWGCEKARHEGADRRGRAGPGGVRSDRQRLRGRRVDGNGRDGGAGAAPRARAAAAAATPAAGAVGARRGRGARHDALRGRRGRDAAGRP